MLKSGEKFPANFVQTILKGLWDGIEPRSSADAAGHFTPGDTVCRVTKTEDVFVEISLRVCWCQQDFEASTVMSAGFYRQKVAPSPALFSMKAVKLPVIYFYFRLLRQNKIPT